MEDSSLQLVSEVGNRILQQSRYSKDFLIKNLKQAVNGLSQLEQPLVLEADSEKVKKALRPLREAIIKHSLALHKDKDVKLLIAICVTEIFRLMAPEVPFEDERLKDIFGLVISMFSELADTRNPYFSKRVKVVETFSRCKCCLIMLDAACSDLILQMFNTLFSAVREHHQQSLINDILSIMTQIINEEASQKLVEVILQSLLKEKKGTPSASSQLAFSVIQACSEKLRPFVCGFLTSCLLERDIEGSELRDSYHQIIYRVFLCSPQMLSPIIPNLVQELLADQVDVRIKTVNLVGKIFVVPEGRAAQDYRLLFVEFLKRFSDKSAEVRKNCLKLIKDIYMANPYGSEVRELLLALESRMLDINDRVRIQAVNTACELVMCNIKRAPLELISQVIERLRDRKATVRKEALKNLMEVYRDYCSKCSVGHMTIDSLFENIPCEVLMLCYAKDCKEFRSHYMELLLAEELFPRLSPSEKTRHWIHIFSLFKPLHIKALDSVLSQKRRFQMELQLYLALRKKDKEVNASESDKREKRVPIFRKLSASFQDTGKAEEWFDKLDQLKDNHIFDALDQSLENMSIVNSDIENDKFVEMMRERHPDFELVRAVGLKCAYNIFGIEHVEYILNYLSADTFERTELEISSAQLLLAIVGYCPYLLKGFEEKLCMLLKTNDLVRDKLVEVLAKAGSVISVKFSDISHVLKMMCLEGTRKQSKVAVSAMAAIMGSSSDETTVSELCKQLVGLLCKDINLPTVLQSLGCIAQHSASVDVYGYITPLILKKIFKMAPSGYLISSIDTSDCNNLCTLKLCALKTLVKSFRPHQETLSNDPFLGLLLKILQTRNTPDIVVSSEKGWDQLRLAAAKSVLRLSRRWDIHIAPETFCCTVLMAKDPCSSFKRSFVGKTFKLLKEHSIPSKYACALVLSASDSNKDIQKESSKYLSEFIKEYNKDTRTRRASALEGGSMIEFPVYTVVFLLYVLAHDPDFPSKEYWDEQTLASFCRPLFCFIEALVNEDSANGDPELVTETFSYLFGLLRAIEKADAVDAQSTSNLHILSKLGSAFAALLSKGNISSRRAPSVILLPSHFYRARSVSKDLAPFTLGEGFIKRTIESFESQITEPTSIFSENSRKNQTSCELPENNKQSARHITNGQVDSLTAKTSGVQNTTTRAASMAQKRKRVSSDECAGILSSTLPRQKRDATVLGKDKPLSSCNNVKKVNSLTVPRENSCNVGRRNNGVLKENAEMGSSLTTECSAGSRDEIPESCCLKETPGSVDLPVGEEQNILISSSDRGFFSGSEDGINPLKDIHKVLDDSEDNRTIRLEMETGSLDTLSTDSLTDGLVFAAKKSTRDNLQQKVLMETTGSNEDKSTSQIHGGKKGNNRKFPSKSSMTNQNDNIVLRRSQRRRG